MKIQKKYCKLKEKFNFKKNKKFNKLYKKYSEKALLVYKFKANNLSIYH